MRWFILILCIPVFMGTHMVHEQLIEKLPLKEDVNASVSLLPPEFLQLTSLGHDALNADLIWLQLIQYYGSAIKAKQPAVHLYSYFDTLTTLDPYFEQAYVFAAYLMADKPEDALKILKKGMRLNPNSSELFFQSGFVSYLYLKKPIAAAAYFKQAADLPNANPNAGRLSALLYAKSTEKQNCELSLQLWQRAIEQAPDGASRQRAEKQFIERRVICDINILEAQLKRYAEGKAKDYERQQRENDDEENPTPKPSSFYPKRLAEMLNRPDAPKDPLGRPYVYQSDIGKVRVKRLPWGRGINYIELEPYLAP